MYETFDHTADVGLRIRADTLDRLFADAAKGLFSLLVANLDDVQPVEETTYALGPDDYDLLLFDWLAELLYTFETRKLLLSQFDVHAGTDGLRATARGEPIDPTRHVMAHEIKAITYHELKVERTDDCWLAEVIVDI
jgi:SHS2 domain-containing protein